MFLVGCVDELLDRGLRSVDHASVVPEVEHPQHSSEHRPHHHEVHTFSH